MAEADLLEVCRLVGVCTSTLAGAGGRAPAARLWEGAARHTHRLLDVQFLVAALPKGGVPGEVHVERAPRED